MTAPVANGEQQELAANLRRLMAREGHTLATLSKLSRLDVRTLRGLLQGTKRAQPRSLHRLAAALEVVVEELFRPAAVVAQQTFGAATNPLVETVVAEHPRLFRHWTAAEFAELASRFGTGGALTYEGALAAAQQMNLRREVVRRVTVLMETHEAPLLAALVDTLYSRVQVLPPGEPASNHTATNER